MEYLIKIIPKVILYAFITGIVGLVIKKINTGGERLEKNQELVQTGRKVYAVIYGTCAVILTGIFLTVIIVNRIKVEINVGAALAVAPLIVLYIATIMCWIWKAEFTETGFYYRKGLRPGRIYAYDEVKYYKYNNYGIMLVCLKNGKSIEILEKNKYWEIIYYLKLNHIEEEKKDWRNGFTIKANNVNVGMGIFCVIISVPILGVMLAFPMVEGICFGVGILLLSLYLFFYTIFDKTIVDVKEKRIIVHRILRRTKYIDMKEMKGIKRRVYGSANTSPSIKVCNADGKVLFKYLESDKNADLFKIIIKNRNLKTM